MTALGHAVPADVTSQIAHVDASVADHRARIDQMMHDRETAPAQHRPVRGVVKGCDLLTVAIDRHLATAHGFIEQSLQRRDELLGHQQRREARLEAIEDARPRLDALTEELERRAQLRVADALGEPAVHLTERLGPIPAGGRERDAWIKGALIIERFRLSHGVTDSHDALDGYDGHRWD